MAKKKIEKQSQILVISAGSHDSKQNYWFDNSTSVLSLKKAKEKMEKESKLFSVIAIRPFWFDSEIYSEFNSRR